MSCNQARLVLSVLMGALLVCSGCSTYLTTGDTGRTVGKVIEAQAFRIVDKDGKVRAVIDIDEHDSPSLRLYDDKGRLRAVLAVFEDGSSHLLFLDEAGNAPTNKHSLP